MTDGSRPALATVPLTSAAFFAPQAWARSVPIVGVLDAYAAKEKAGARTSTTLADGGNAATRLMVTANSGEDLRVMALGAIHRF